MEWAAVSVLDGIFNQYLVSTSINQANGACTDLCGGKPGYISDLYDETVLQEERGISILSICCR